MAQSASQQQAQSQSQTQSQTQTQSSSSSSADPLAEAARKARQAQKTAPKAAVVFTNDNLPASASGVSVVGSTSSASATGDKSAKGSSAASQGKNDEASWRKKFADAHHKLDQDQSELAIMQRELSELQLQYYPNDPTKALMQSVTRSDITKKQDAIDKKQKDIAADKQAISDLEDALRQAGGDASWAQD
ncbi:MAG TPA: hypothetical protein VGR81_01525 [Candidatus Acidoferrales bacterium]|nr:hypothetical protein [Candidatus Acidoferrales bacterium]